MSARKVKTTKKQITTRSIAARAVSPASKARIISTKRAPVYILEQGRKTRIPDEKVSLVFSIIKQDQAPDEILSTQDAADLLNVSRPYLVKLIDEEKRLKAFYVGNQRRLYKKDVLAYKKAMRSNQLQALADLTKESEDLELDF